MEQVGVFQAEDVSGDERQHAQHDQQDQLLRPQDTHESLEPDLASIESPHFKQALDSGLLDHRYNQSACGIIDNCFVTWHPSILPLHLEFTFNFLGSDSTSRYLAFVLNDKTDHPIFYAVELVAATRKRLVEAQAETQLLLDQLNKIMAESFTHPWWLPIVAERVRQNTISHAQKINASHQDLQNLDPKAVQELGILINEGEIDPDLLFPLISSKDQPLASTEPTGVDTSNVNRAESDSQQDPSKFPLISSKDQPLASTEPTGVDTSNENRAESDPQQDPSKFPNDGSGAQSSHDASIADRSKKDLKNERKKDKKRAKRLATNQAQTQHSTPEVPTVTQRDASAISTKSDHSKDPTNAQLNAPDNLSAPENPEDPTVAKPDVSTISTESDHPEDPTSAQLNAPDIVNAPEPLEDPTTAQPNVSAISTQPELPADPTITNLSASDVNAQEHLKNPIFAKPDLSTISTESDHPEDPTSAQLNAPDIVNAPEPLEDPTTAQPNVSAISTQPELPADPIITNLSASDVNAQEHLKNPIVAKPDLSAISTELELSADSTIINPHAPDILSAQKPVEDPIVAKPDLSAISTELELSADPTVINPHASDILSAQKPVEDPIVAKTDLSAISTELELSADPTVINPHAPDILSAQKPVEDPIVAETDVSATSTEPGRLEIPVIFEPSRSAISTAPEHPEHHKNIKTYASEHDINHPILAKPGISAESTKTSAADPTEVRTENPISNLPEDSNNDITNSPTQESVEESRDEDISDTEHSNVDEFSEDSGHSVEDEEDLFFPGATSEPVSGVMGLRWAYATYTPADNMLAALGIWLFEKPSGHFRWQPYVWKRKGLGIEQAPVVIDTLGDATRLPKAEFDNQVLYINTHTVPWADLRANYAHPDTLFPTKLVEYQAAESMGLNVWRHDRNLLDCRLVGCRAKVADHNPTSVVCPGCGPKTIIRYCSVAHLVADLREHWTECGHHDLVIKRVVDQTTAPARFDRLCPAIRDSHGTKSYALYRQGLFSMLNHGRYTLFDWVTEEPTVLVWTGEDVRRGEMERRVERLLNLALFDQRNKAMVGFLFRLLRQCLQLKNSWSVGTSYALQKQFGEEFGLDGSKVEEDGVCECEWVGEGLADALHLPACRRLYRRFGRAFQGSGMRGYLEMYEARYWILRAWQQQHAAVRHWSDRVAGEGWEGVEEVEGTSPELGPGWTGWGGADDDRSV